MKESTYRRMIKDIGLLKFNKKSRKSLLSEKLINELNNKFDGNETTSLKEFLKRNGI